jgi:murein DD-endopeptidase MepM/ murein hydrolase activator NlpD
VGNEVYNAYLEPVNVRRTPGYLSKATGDVTGKLPPGAGAKIVAGPQDADALRWWRIEARIGSELVAGWMAEVSPSGQRFLVPLSLRGAIQLGRPFAGSWRVTQLFGDRPAFYKQFSYDGVALRGHNGIDFGIPNGTDLLATDGGQVVQVGFESNGFGYYVKLVHPWGESLYAHMKSVGVQEGTQVARGDVLGPSDNTGNSSGPHLHFGIRVLPYRRGDGWGGCCDPAPFMNPDDLIIPDSIRGAAAMLPPPGMAPDAPGRERP